VRAARGPVTTDRAIATLSGGLTRQAVMWWLGAIAVGLVGFFLTVEEAPQRAWQSVWSNFLFWTAIAQAGVMFGAVLHTAKGHWGKTFRRVAEGMGAFLPLSLALFVLLYFGAGYVFPWLQPVEGHVNRTWLTLDGVFIRDGILLLILYAASFVFLRFSLRPDARAVAEYSSGWRRTFLRRMSRNWRGDEEEVRRSTTALARMGPALILAWAAVFTVLAIDFGMSLIPGFISVVWGPYYFIGGWLSMLALLAVLTNRYRQRYDLAEHWGKWEFHDLGKLLFAFTIFWTYLWFSQYLVIWYGNIARETAFFEQRTRPGFSFWFWLQMVLIFGIPFALLLFRHPKMRSGYLAFVALFTLAGFWLERYNMVVPSIWSDGAPPMGWQELFISIGFVGLFGLSYSIFASTFPKLPIHDTLPGRASRGP
jgi:hypothetical protein